MRVAVVNQDAEREVRTRGIKSNHSDEDDEPGTFLTTAITQTRKENDKKKTRNTMKNLGGAEKNLGKD
jgi:hypothetical protein